MNDNDNKLHIYQDKNLIEITLKWYTPTAWFLLFFCAIWCGFLFFFYGMLASSGGAPTFAFLFPLIHVAVGIGLSYYTACLFFNKTYVDVVDGNLSVHHDPIPWWRGNASLAINTIEQLYVKEKISRGKNGTTTTYSLRAKLKDGKDKALLKIGSVNSDQLQQIENSLEEFLGIEDTPVKGEYGAVGKWNTSKMKSPQRRKQRRGFSEEPLESIYLSDAGGFIIKKAQSSEILSSTQYDWNDGNSDKLFQLSTADKKEELLFIAQNRAILKPFEEVQIPLSKAYSIGFKHTNPQSIFNYDGNRYTIDHHSKGKKFVSGLSESIEVEQWKYITSDGKKMIRIIGDQGALTYYYGQALDADDFGQGLDLNQENRPIIEDRPGAWEDEDFV